ncbi:MAG: isochorismate synthase [Balneolaceae bacterium]|nr:isochorismate synthase [Balneolaceae bacterium]
MDAAIPLFNQLADCFEQQITPAELSQAITAFRISPKEQQDRYLSCSISITEVDPLAVLEQHGQTHAFQYYWEKPSDKFAIAAAGTLERIQSTGSGRFKESSSKGKELLSRVQHVSSLQHHLATVHLLGGFSFFDHNIGDAWREFGAGSFTLPEWTIVREGRFTVLTITKGITPSGSIQEIYNRFLTTLNELEEVCKAGSYSIPAKKSWKTDVNVPDAYSLENKQWTDAIENATDLIKSGEFKKVVLARQLKVKLNQPVSDTHILNNLRHQYPDCFSFLIRQNAESSFIGCTPERLASFKKRLVFTEGLAGSISRGKTASEDAVLEHELLHSKKDLSEHSFVLDAIEENLNRFSEVLEHPEKPKIKKLSNVQHLYTPVRAKIRDDVSRTEVLAKLHPTPAVGGYPREQAVPFIHKLEHFDRGWYAAPIGWINAHGEGEFAVAIRSGLIKKEEVCFFAGCGIVRDSDPQKEWEETNLKFIPMLTALEYARN